MASLIEAIREARRDNFLPECFTPDDVRVLCPGWAPQTYETFLPKHRRKNPGGYTVYFERNEDGTYSLIRT